MTLERTVAIALEQVGTTEVPWGSNFTVYGAQLTYRYGLVTLSNGNQISRDGQEWCATFVAWCWHAGHLWPAQWGLPVVDFYTPADRNAWRAQGLWDTIGQVGDHIYFDWSNDGTVDHVGLIVDDLGGAWRTVEGNVSNAVQTFIRPKNWRQIAGYGRTPYPIPIPTVEDDDVAIHLVRSDGSQPECLLVSGALIGFTDVGERDRAIAATGAGTWVVESDAQWETILRAVR